MGQVSHDRRNFGRLKYDMNPLEHPTVRLLALASLPFILGASLWMAKTGYSQIIYRLDRQDEKIEAQTRGFTGIAKTVTEIATRQNLGGAEWNRRAAEVTALIKSNAEQIAKNSASLGGATDRVTAVEYRLDAHAARLERLEKARSE